jgi:phosphatidylglycerophosphate synthase
MQSIAVVLTSASPTLARVKVCGLTIAERARRVATRSGISNVLFVSNASEAAAARLTIDAQSDATLYVIDCTEQIIHLPLLAPLLQAESGGVAVSAGANSFAGAVRCDAEMSRAFCALLNTGTADLAQGLAQLAQSALTRGVAACVHGDIARHPVATPEQRKQAIHFLFGLVRKAQDTPLIRFVNRRVSYPFTRMLLPTPITPNKISIVVFIIGVVGCYFAAVPNYVSPIIGTLIILFAGYLDGCDGEIARIRLEGSKLGAWIDTIADETTTVLFLVASGLHCYRRFGDQWWLWTIAVGTASALLAVYVIYYYLIVVAKSGNSQDYPAGASSGIVGVLRLVVKRDFINLAAVGFAVANQFVTMYILVVVGAVTSAAVLTPQHIALRMQRRRISSSVRDA